jgi:hypothetical protein
VWTDRERERGRKIEERKKEREIEQRESGGGR